jgi:hypothetical protein
MLSRTVIRTLRTSKPFTIARPLIVTRTTANMSHLATLDVRKSPSACPVYPESHFIHAIDVYTDLFTRRRPYTPASPPQQ